MFSIAKTLLKFHPIKEFQYNAPKFRNIFRVMSDDFYEKCEFCRYNVKIDYPYTRYINYDDRKNYLCLLAPKRKCQYFKPKIFH